MTAHDAALLEAHAASDLNRLVSIYAAAANDFPNEEESAFFLTHAYVFALEADHPDMPHLRARLIEMGREEPPLPPRPPRR
ncbi:MAG: hypothetical protein P1U53_08910 [Sulfitobacter sp.]|nr:hypothetical protein [Sulfitobacter sp.]